VVLSFLKVPLRMANIGLLFPGQGAQAVGMGRELTNRSASAKALFDRASEILGYDLLDLCINGPEEKLTATVHSQPALFVHSMASMVCLLDTEPDLLSSVVAVAGLSLGEYSALSAARGITFEDGVRLVQIRGSAMQEAAEAQASGMASVLGLTTEQVEQVCNDARIPDEILRPANFLCPGNTAISGHARSIEAAENVANQAGAMKFIRLNVAGAFHTDIMLPAVEKLEAGLGQVQLHATRFPVFSNVDAQPHTQPDELRFLLSRQVVSPVQWEATLRNMIAAGVEQFYEIGAGRVLAGTLKRIDRKIPCTCFGDN
jgi:[acyl-carrier-protein] S-malonyltransferase